jgi:hypothetical protein
MFILSAIHQISLKASCGKQSEHKKGGEISGFRKFDKNKLKTEKGVGRTLAYLPGRCILYL